MKLKDFNNEIEAREHFSEKPFDKEPEEMTKGKIQKEFYDLIESMWKDPKVDVFYIQSYAWDWVEILLDKQKEDIKEMIKASGDGYWGTKAYNEGYAQAQADILKKINK